MSYNNYDFRVSQSACVKALEGYLQMETLMESKKATLLYATDNTDRYWSGKSQSYTKENILPFLNSGIYDKSYQKVKKMHICLEMALPQINLLLARCEGFVEQLQHDIYVEPCKPAEGDNRELNGGILALNYEYVSQIRNTCDTILEENEQITMSLTEVLNNCEELLGGTDKDMARLTAASDKVKRIENYKNAFQAYAFGVMALELDLESRLKEIISVGGIFNPFVTLGENAAQMSGGFTDYDNISDVKMLATAIFKKDVSEWNEVEAEFIACTWDDAIQNGKVDLIEMYTREMFVAEYSESEGNYQVKGDMQKVTCILKYLNSKTQGTAYYTLNRLGNMKSDIQTVKKSNVHLSKDKICKAYVMESEGTIQIKVTAYTPSGAENEKICFEDTITLCDMNDIVDANMERSLKKFGYEIDDVEAVRLSIISDTDIQFAHEFYAQNYEDAFKINPEHVSEKMLESIGKHMLKLEDLASGTEELEEILNILLSADPKHCPRMTFSYFNGEYLNMITNELKYLSEQDVDKIKVGEAGGYTDEELKQFVLEGEEYYNQYSLWEAVCRIYDLDIKYNDAIFTQNAHRDGEAHMQITNLDGGIGSTPNKNGNGCYSFDMEMVDIVDESPVENLDYYFHISLEYPSHLDFTNDKLVEEIKELNYEKKMLPLNMMLDILGDGADMLGGGGALIRLCRSMTNRDYEDIIDEIGDIPYSDYINTENKFNGASSAPPVMADVIKTIFLYSNIEKDIESKNKKYEINNWGKYTCMKIELLGNDEKIDSDCDRQYIGYQMFTAEKAYKLHQLKKGGLKVYLEDVIDTDNIRDDQTEDKNIIQIIAFIQNETKLTEEEWNQLFISDTVEAIRLIDDAVKKYNGKMDSLSDWLD